MLGTSVSAAIVLDANVAVWAVVPTLPSATVDTAARLATWNDAGVQFVAPMLWLAECTSALRSAVYMRTLSVEQAQVALADIFALEVELRALTPALCLAALDWAGRLRQAKAYDSFYLALAEQLGAEFWSADRRLINSARQAGAGWAHWVGEG